MTEKQLALDKERLARERLSPFIEAAMGQLIAEIPHTRSGYDLLKRIKARIDDSCTKRWVPKKRLCSDAESVLAVRESSDC